MLINTKTYFDLTKLPINFSQKQKFQEEGH